jgi:hypothetical protein
MTNNQVYNNQIITNNQKPINQTGSGIGYWNLGFIWSLGFGYWLLFFMTLCLFVSPAAQAAVGPNWIEQWGITWTFDKNISTDGADGTYQYGQFVTGDYWIVGPVTLISIDPLSQNINGRIKNGSMINPPIGNVNGYDNAMSYNTYSASLNVAFGVTPLSTLVVPVNSSLISTISVDTPNSRPQVDTAAILTVLVSAPEDAVNGKSNYFRPPYCGTDKTLQFKKTDLNYSKLKRLAPVSYTPSLNASYGPESSVAAYKTPLQWFQRPWIDHGTEDPGRFIRPLNNCPDYGREISRYTNWAALLLNLNFTDSEKEPLMIGMVQYGIDLYRIVSLNHTSFVGNGTIASGRLLPILFAGFVLDAADGAEALRNIGQKTGQYRYENGYTSGNLPPDYIHFLETNQTHYVTQTDVDVTLGKCLTGDRYTYRGAASSSQIIGTMAVGNEVLQATTNARGVITAIKNNSSDPDWIEINRTSAVDFDIANGYQITDQAAGGYFIPSYRTRWAVSGTWKPDYRDVEIIAYQSSDIGFPEWGIRNARTPQNNNKSWSTAYRLSSSPVIAGTALVAHIMGIKDLFNHPAMFDYADRYVQYIFSGEYDILYASDPYGKDSPDVWRYGVNGFEFYKNAPFTKNMWDAYREYCGGPLWPEKAVIIYGDVSGDGLLSAYDAALAARIAVGLDAYPTGDNLTKADVSGDGFVTAYDAALIAQKAVGLITKFPVES